MAYLVTNMTCLVASLWLMSLLMEGHRSLAWIALGSIGIDLLPALLGGVVGEVGAVLAVLLLGEFVTPFVDGCLDQSEGLEVVFDQILETPLVHHLLFIFCLHPTFMQSVNLQHIYTYIYWLKALQLCWMIRLCLLEHLFLQAMPVGNILAQGPSSMLVMMSVCLLHFSTK